MTWKFEPLQKVEPKLKSPVLIVGLPGIANVGKIAADFIIDEIKAKKLYNLFSYDLPNSVFVNDRSLVELPTIEMYFKTGKGSDLLILTGDVQPADEHSSYELCEQVLDVAKKFGVKLIITLGGIGLAEVPKKAQVFCTGNSKAIMKDFSKGHSINHQLYGIVGPIIGVSGLMIGLAGRRKMPAICLLAETLGHPAFLGIKAAREIVKVLNKKFSLKININALDKEIEEIECEMKKTTENTKISKKSSLKKMQSMMHKDTSYIG